MIQYNNNNNNDNKVVIIIIIVIIIITTITYMYTHIHIQCKQMSLLRWFCFNVEIKVRKVLQALLVFHGRKDPGRRWGGGTGDALVVINVCAISASDLFC